MYLLASESIGSNVSKDKLYEVSHIIDIDTHYVFLITNNAGKKHTIILGKTRKTQLDHIMFVLDNNYKLLDLTKENPSS